MALNLTQKQEVVAELAQVAGSAHSLVAAEYAGLTVEQLTELAGAQQGKDPQVDEGAHHDADEQGEHCGVEDGDHERHGGTHREGGDQVTGDAGAERTVEVRAGAPLQRDEGDDRTHVSRAAPGRSTRLR